MPSVVRKISNPKPGEPLGNVEKNRCRFCLLNISVMVYQLGILNIIAEGHDARIPQTWNLFITLLWYLIESGESGVESRECGALSDQMQIFLFLFKLLQTDSRLSRLSTLHLLFL